METIFLLFLPILFFFLFFKRKPSSSNLPPGPKPWPLIGNLPEMGNKPHVALAELAKTHGPLISLRLGTQLVVVGSSPQAATEMLKTKDHLLSGRLVPHVSFAKDPEMNKDSIAWSLECNERWKFFRTLMRNELFSSKMVEGQADIREKKASQMVDYVTQKQGQKLLLREVAFAYVFNVLANIYISQDLTDFEGEKSVRVNGLIREMMELYTSPNVSDLFPVLGRLDLQGLRRSTDDCVKKIREMWEPVIKERRVSNGDGGRRRDFLDALIECGLDDLQISFNFVEMLAAVSDSTSSTIEWALSELIRSPESLLRLRQELSQEFNTAQKNGPGGPTITDAQVANLPYLHACVKEVLRLHPPAPILLPHRATEDTQILGYTVPKDTQVFVNVWAIARDPSIWEDPLRFRPERFLGSEVDYKGNYFEYLPFGSGRRICAGLPMAVRKVQLGLACLVHNFDWALPEGMKPSDLDMSERYGVTLMKEEALVLVPTRRN